MAENVDYIIVFAGIEEGEFQDRSRLDLEEKVEDVNRVCNKKKQRC